MAVGRPEHAEGKAPAFSLLHSHPGLIQQEAHQRPHSEHVQHVPETRFLGARPVLRNTTGRMLAKLLSARRTAGQKPGYTQNMFEQHPQEHLRGGFWASAAKFHQLYPRVDDVFADVVQLWPTVAQVGPNRGQLMANMATGASISPHKCFWTSFCSTSFCRVFFRAFPSFLLRPVRRRVSLGPSLIFVFFRRHQARVKGVLLSSFVCTFVGGGRY